MTDETQSEIARLRLVREQLARELDEDPSLVETWRIKLRDLARQEDHTPLPRPV